MWFCCCQLCDDDINNTEQSRLLINHQSLADDVVTRPTTNTTQHGGGQGRAAHGVMSWAESGDFSADSIWSKVATRGECPPTLTMKPVSIASVDKRLQDHTALYNGLVEQWKQLDALMIELSRMFPEHNQQRTIEGAFRHLSRLIASSQSVSVVTPHKDSPCPQVAYDGRDVPYQAIPAFIAFNASGKLVRQLVGKCPAVSGSLRLVLDDERKLVRDVMVASLGADGPTCIANCRDDLALLRQVALPGIDDIERRTGVVAAQLKTAADILQRHVHVSSEII